MVEGLFFAIIITTNKLMLKFKYYFYTILTLLVIFFPNKSFSDNHNLNEIINEANEYLLFDKEKLDLEKIIDDQKSDQDIKDFATKELADLIEKNQTNEKKLKIYLLPKDEADTKNAIIENA